MQMFPKNVAFIYAMTEASFSFAEMVGPTVGALLYDAGGFALPFQICGGLCFLTGTFSDHEFLVIWSAIIAKILLLSALFTLAVLPGSEKEKKVRYILNYLLWEGISLDEKMLKIKSISPI